MRISRPVLLISAPLVLVAISVLVLALRSCTPDRPIVTGMVETSEIDVASKVPGRIDSLAVREGDRVEKGQLLARLSSREVDAKVEQARGMMEAADAKLRMARTGARPQERDAMERKYLASQHQFDLAEKTWRRIESLFADSVVSAQERDQTEFKYKAAKEELEAIRAQYDMVKEGVRHEEREAAEALYYQAENAYKEALAYQDETRLIAPIAGEISKRVADEGEMIAAGYPVVSIFDPDNVWIVLHLREDQMSGIRQGNQYPTRVTAVDKQEYQFVVSYIAAMADYATWRSTSQKGEYDLKTFEIHLTPVQKIDGLRPGMTAQVEL
jgi:HlyD family secretion protein